MKLILSTDYGEVLDSWIIPNMKPTNVEDILDEGFWREHKLDCCPDCNTFVPHDTIVEIVRPRSNAEYPDYDAVCPKCAKKY